jgi:hypothetical protein
LRQAFFANELRKQGADVLEVYPERWGNLSRPGGFEVHGEGNIYAYVFGQRAIQKIEKFKCDWLYCMMEPNSLLAYQMNSLASRLRCHFACFTWENIEKTYPFPFQQEVLNHCDLIVCGNKAARQIMLNKGVDPSRLVTTPQVGVNTEFFRPMEVEKEWDCIYFGRPVPEKGISYIKKACEELSLSLKMVTNTPYDQIPDFLNKSKLTVSFPYETPSWKPQFEYNIAESLACGVPVVTSDAGSIPEVYGRARGVAIKPQRNLWQLKEGLKEAFGKSWEPCLVGRRWVEENLSNEVVASNLLEAFKLGE